MRHNKPTLSDWIVFLSDVVSRRQSFLGLIFTSFFSIVVLMFALATLYVNYTSLAAFFAANNVPFTIGGMSESFTAIFIALIVTYGIMMFYYIYEFNSKKSKYSRAKDLLLKIMKHEITRVDEIENEWFFGDEKED